MRFALGNAFRHGECWGVENDLSIILFNLHPRAALNANRLSRDAAGHHDFGKIPIFFAMICNITSFAPPPTAAWRASR